MAQKSTKKKVLNLIASLLVIAVLILAWHFIVPAAGKITDLMKVVSYSLLLFNVVWILDALLAFKKYPAELSTQDKVAKAQMFYAMIGFIAFLLFSALIHGVVSVFFADGGLELMIGGFAKCALTLIGFALLLQCSLHVGGKKIWVLVSGLATFVVGVIFSTFLAPNAATGIMVAVTAICFLADVFLTGKKEGVSPIRFTVWEAVYVGIMALALLIIRYIPIRFPGNHVATFAVRAAVDLAFAIVIDAIFLIVGMIVRKKKAAKN